MLTSDKAITSPDSQKSFSVCFLFVIGLWAGFVLTGCKTQSSETLVDYGRTGGFANFDDSLLIELNGNTIVTRKTQTCEFVSDDDVMDQLQTAFDEAVFSELDRRYLPDNQGSDLTEYTITYEGHTVRTMDSTVPEDIWPVLELLNQIVEKCEGP